MYPVIWSSFEILWGILRDYLLTIVVKEDDISFVIGQGCEAVCSGRYAACRLYKGTYCPKCIVVMEAACPSDTSILVYQIPPFQTPEHRILQATVWKPQISKVARMFQYTRTNTQTHKNSFWIGFGFWGHLDKIRHIVAILSRIMLTRSYFRIAKNNRFVKFLYFSRFI